MARGVSMSSDLIYFCMKNNIAIDFLQFNGQPFAKIVNPQKLKSNIFLAQTNAINTSKASKYVINLISASVKNRTNLIKYFGKYRQKHDKDFRLNYQSKIKQMETIQAKIKNLETNDHQKLKAEIFMLEAQAAQIYWFMIARIIDQYIKFEGRKKRGATDPVNVMINYGYGILYTRTWRALHKARLNPYIGYLHSNQRGDPALVFDFIEEFRQQAVDRTIVAMITKKEKVEIKNGKLSDQARAKIVQNVTERLNDFEVFRQKRMRLEDIMNHQAQQLAKFLLD